MIREEQTKKQADIYTDDVHNYTEWSDTKSNLKSLWHDVNEKPKNGQWFLAQIGDNAFDTFIMEMDKNEDWKEWSNGINVKRWACIDDLLPKKRKLLKMKLPKGGEK